MRYSSKKIIRHLYRDPLFFGTRLVINKSVIGTTDVHPLISSTVARNRSIRRIHPDNGPEYVSYYRPLSSAGLFRL